MAENTGITGTGDYERPTQASQGQGPTGGDPFAYTNNSLLTPWTGIAPTATGGGGAAADMPAFSYKDMSYDFKPYGEYTANKDFTGTYAQADQFGYNQPIPNAGEGMPGAFNYQQGGPTYLSQGPVGGLQPPPNWSGGATGDPRTAEQMAQYRQQGEAAGQDMSWMDRPGATTPQGGVPGQSATGLGMPNQFQGVAAFQAPTITDDPSYKFRVGEGLDALQNTALGRGTRGGDVQQALMNYGQQAGSQEYAAAWQRAMGAQQNAYNQAQNTYGMNAQTQLQYDQNRFGQSAQAQQMNLARGGQMFGQQLAAQGQGFNQAQTAFGMNEANRQAAFDRTQGVHQMNEQNRLAAYGANAANANNMGQLGWQTASGVYDRNRQNAMDAWTTQHQIAAGKASAANAAAANSAGASWAQYNDAKDTFYTNQQNQYSRLYGMSNLGMNANEQAGGYAGDYNNAYANNTQGAANAYAAGTMNMGNAIGDAAGRVGGYAMGMTMDNGYNPGIGTYYEGYPGGIPGQQ